MTKLLILIILIVTQVQAGSYLLKAPGCDWLEDRASDISEWSGKSDLDNISCDCNSENCEIDIFSILPNTVQKVVNGYNAYGPNCWNAALVGANILPNFLYTTPNEIEFWLETPLCRMLDAEEQALPGDIIEVRLMKSDIEEGIGPPGYWPEYEENKIYTRQEVHGMIYLADDLVFTKNGASAGHGKYEIMPLFDAYQTYGVSMKCHQLGFIPQDEDEVGCGTFTWSNIYRCQEAVEYFSDFQMDMNQSQVYRDLLALEEKIVFILFVDKKTKASMEQIEAWKAEYYRIKAMIPKYSYSSEDHSLFWQILSVHGHSILRQIHNLTK